MKGKRLLAALICGILSVSLTACTGDAGASPAVADETPALSDAEQTAAGGSIKLALWDANQEVFISPLVQEWGEKNGIEVSVEVTPWEQYWTMLEASATGGSMPDVMWMHSNQVERYARNALIMDLDSRIAGSELVDMTKFPEDISNVYHFEGRQYGIPKDLDTMALWYNKSMFDEVGLDYPDETWTWDTLKDAARRLTKEDGSQYGFVHQAREDQMGYWNFIYQNGGYVINADRTQSGWADPKTIEAMEYVMSFFEEGICPNATTVAENRVETLLQSGTVAMGFAGSWMMGPFQNNDYFVENFDCAVLPSAPDGTRATIYNGLGWAAAAGTPNPDAAWALLEYLGGEEAQVKLAQACVCNISAHEAGRGAWGQSDERFHLQAYVDMVPYGIPFPSSINTVVWNDMQREKVAEMLLMERPVAEICAEIEQEMNTMLAAERA